MNDEEEIISGCPIGRITFPPDEKDLQIAQLRKEVDALHESLEELEEHIKWLLGKVVS